MPNVNPVDWLQFGALGLLGLGMMFAAFVVWRIVSKLLDTRQTEQLALIEALQTNAAALAGIQATIQGIQTVMLRCQVNDVKKEKECNS